MADLARVSVGTVSHVITGTVQVSEALRLKVQAAIQQLDYHPNHIARSLKTSKTRTLGIIVPDLTISFFPRIIRGAEMAARERGYSLIAVTSADDPERQQELLSLLRSQRVEGILLITTAAPIPPEQVARVIDAGIPVVCVDRVPEDIAVDSVSVDDLTAAELGVSHLISMGYRRIAIVTGPLSLKNERHRLQGYKKCLERSGIPLDKSLIWHGNLCAEDVATLCHHNLSTVAVRPDAFFCTNGPTALGALEALQDRGLKIPDDIGFVTFDELTSHEIFSPAITTIIQPAYEIGFHAAGILLKRIEGDAVGTSVATIRLPATLKVRASSSPQRN